VKIVAEWRVYALGAILWVALTICSRNFGDRGGPYFMASLTLAGVAYLFANREFFTRPRFPRRMVILGLILAAVWQIEFLRIPSAAGEDIHRYVWDGRLQRLGYNPYVVVPSDPAVKGLHTSETRNMSSPDLPSPYPPGAQLFFRGVTSIRESTFAMRTAFVICDFAIAFVLLDMLRLNRQGGHLVLAYAWNPLLALEVAGSGHIDILGALLLLVSLAALGRRWRTTAAVGLGLAISIKLLPVVLLPLYWKRIRIRDAALAAIVVGLLYMPFLRHGHLSTGSLGTYVQSFRFNGPVFAMLDHVAPPRLLAGLAVLVGLVIATWIRGAAPEWSAEVVAWPMAASLLFSPVVFPWYLLWLVPFVTSASTVLIFVWTVSIIPTYIMWHLRTIGRPWGPLPGWVMLLEYGSVALVAAILALRRGISRPKMLSRSTE
jgi:alpha-1,6-mannosyltransferase